MPVLMVDVKGDLPNLLLSFPSFGPAHIEPWVESGDPNDERTARERAQAFAEERKQRLTEWDITEAQLAAHRERSELRVITPGSTAGELLHVLSSLERSERWITIASRRAQR